MSSAKSETENEIVMSGWAQHQRNPGKHMTGLIAVTAIHGIALWLIMSGIGQKIAKQVLPSSIVEVMLPPPPPPPPPKPPEPPKPKNEPPPPPPAFIPPSEVPVFAPTSAPVIQATPTPPPPAAVYIPAPPAPPVPQGPRGFGSMANRSECAGAFGRSYPREARRSGEEGSVTLSVRVGADGRVVSAEVTDSVPRRVFDRAALGVINSGICRFQPDTAGYQAVLVISYKLSGVSDD